jgi:hypothetical protein
LLPSPRHSPQILLRLGIAQCRLFVLLARDSESRGTPSPSTYITPSSFMLAGSPSAMPRTGGAPARHAFAREIEQAESCWRVRRAVAVVAIERDPARLGLLASDWSRRRHDRFERPGRSRFRLLHLIVLPRSLMSGEGRTMAPNSHWRPADLCPEPPGEVPLTLGK